MSKKVQMFYQEIINEIERFEYKSTEEIKQEIRSVFETWKHDNSREFFSRVNIPRNRFYMITKRNNYRPSFETYIRIINVGNNLVPKRKNRVVQSN